MSKPKKKKTNSLFTEEPESWTIPENCGLSNFLQVRREFRTHFKTWALQNDVYGMIKNGLYWTETQQTEWDVLGSSRSDDWGSMQSSRREKGNVSVWGIGWKTDNPLHWFDIETSVNEITILRCFKLLSGQKWSTKLLPAKQCYFQQDGAPPHWWTEVLVWLTSFRTGQEPWPVST